MGRIIHFSSLTPYFRNWSGTETPGNFKLLRGDFKHEAPSLQIKPPGAAPVLPVLCLILVVIPFGLL
jgi:hypothetical protein